MSPFREISLLPPESQNRLRIANPQISRGSSAQRPGFTDRRSRVLHATVPSGSGPARKHTAKFEPAARGCVELCPNIA